MNLGMLLLHSPVLKGEHLLRMFTRVLFTFCVIHVEEEAGRAVQLLRAGLTLFHRDKHLQDSLPKTSHHPGRGEDAPVLTL